VTLKNGPSLAVMLPEKKKKKKESTGPKKVKKGKETKKSKKKPGVELKPEFSVLQESDVKIDFHDRNKFLGDGMYGKVYKGECFSKPVAIKVLNVQEKDYQSGEDYESDMECLITEVNIMMKNSHPNIMTLIGVCPKTKEGKTLIVMELEDGDLFHLLVGDDGKPTPVALAMTMFDRLKLIKDAALGMEFLHSIDPAIIHRDLKLENLMYKRVDNSYLVRLSDFGLSAYKPREVKKLSSDGRGNNLTKAPEVMMGKDFDEKADVYSFAMCMWEIVHCTPLYPDIQDAHELFDKVVRKGMRPQLQPDIIPSLKALFERMWDANPISRPYFSEINRCLDEILVDAAIPHPLGRKFWKEHWLKEHAVKWSTFVDKFYTTLGVRFPDKAKRRARRPEDEEDVIKYKCVKALLVVDKQESQDMNCVRVQDFGYFLSWFGGFGIKHGKSLLDRVVHLLSQAWFHGDIERMEAQRRLEGQEEGAFLVRFSKSTPGGFAITKLDQVIRRKRSNANGKGKKGSKKGAAVEEEAEQEEKEKENINYVMRNYSISQNDDGFTFVITGHQTQQAAWAQQEKYPDLVALIESFRSKISLLASCPGSRFRGLFEGPAPVEMTGYDNIVLVG